MKRILKSWVVLVLCLSFLFFDSDNAKADIWSGTRVFYGVKYTSSVTNTNFYANGIWYSYAKVFDDARAEWQGHSGISIPKTEHGFADKYYIGSTSDPDTTGQIFPVNMSKFGYSYTNRFATATHEVGHSLKLKHTTSSDKSVMIQGKKTYGAQTYDYNELERKW
jgi:hypothetical protein